LEVQEKVWECREKPFAKDIPFRPSMTEFGEIRALFSQIFLAHDGQKGYISSCTPTGW